MKKDTVERCKGLFKCKEQGAREYPKANIP